MVGDSVGAFFCAVDERERGKGGYIKFGVRH